MDPKVSNISTAFELLLGKPLQESLRFRTFAHESSTSSIRLVIPWREIPCARAISSMDIVRNVNCQNASKSSPQIRRSASITHGGGSLEITSDPEVSVLIQLGRAYRRDCSSRLNCIVSCALA